MDIKDIQELLKFINRSTLTDVEIEQNDFRLRVQRRPEGVGYLQMQQQPFVPQQQQPYAAALPLQPPGAITQTETPVAEPKPVETASGNEKNLKEFLAPFIGTFYRSNSPEKEPFVKVGDKISKGKILGIIEAMKLFNEIESDIEGTIVKILVENARPVEFNQPLFLIEVQ
ncbi:MAG: acetyl-CoA carboxylase biotin carboxyl carrier protein [Bacteroidota bacterium]|jgi:acetyl-CoA carboxylase biotin carboxyl carrier protein